MEQHSTIHNSHAFQSHVCLQVIRIFKTAIRISRAPFSDVHVFLTNQARRLTPCLPRNLTCSSTLFVLVALSSHLSSLSYTQLSVLFKGPGWTPGTPRLGDPADLPEVGKVQTLTIIISTECMGFHL